MQVRVLTAAAGLIVISSATAACGPLNSSAGSAPASSAAASGSPAAASGAPASTAASSGGQAAAGSGGGTLDVCSFMTSAQASSINSVTYGAATPKHVTGGYDTCTYKNNGAADPVDIQALTVTVVSTSGCYDELEQADGPGVKVSGAGDDAFGYQIGIIVKVGVRCLDVSGLTDAELHNNYGPDTAMAKVIIAKLP